MSAANDYVKLDVLEKRLEGWEYYAIEDTWSAHSPGLWVAKFISPDSSGRRSYCCVSLEIGEYLALFFAPKKSGMGWELVDQVAIKDELEDVRDWLESFEVD